MLEVGSEFAKSIKMNGLVLPVMVLDVVNGVRVSSLELSDKESTSAVSAGNAVFVCGTLAK